MIGGKSSSMGTYDCSWSTINIWNPCGTCQNIVNIMKMGSANCTPTVLTFRLGSEPGAQLRPFFIHLRHEGLSFWSHCERSQDISFSSVSVCQRSLSADLVGSWRKAVCSFVVLPDDERYFPLTLIVSLRCLSPWVITRGVQV